MNVTLGSLAIATALVSSGTAVESTAQPLEYAVPAIELPCVAAKCGGALLVDLELELTNPPRDERGLVRLLLGERLYLGLGSDDEGQSLSLAGARWDFELEHDGNRAGLAAEYRARRLRVTARADDHDARGGDGLRLAIEAGWRLGPDLELVAAAVDDERSRYFEGPAIRPTSSVSVGARWQRGSAVDLEARLTTATVETPAGFELDSRKLEVATVRQARNWLLEADLGLEDLDGRFERQEATARLDFEYRIFRHLVARAVGWERYDLDDGSIERDVSGGLTYYARRFRFARRGEAARQTVALARRAWELGFNERRAHDLEGRRRLRERLALASGELARHGEDLRRSQIEERNVALGGVMVRRRKDQVDGSRVRAYEVFLAVPWPRSSGQRPVSHDEAATDFLRFTYGHLEREISAGFSTEGSSLSMDLSLNRELGLRLAWRDPAATGRQFALGTKEPGELRFSLFYRRGI